MYKESLVPVYAYALSKREQDSLSTVLFGIMKRYGRRIFGQIKLWTSLPISTPTYFIVATCVVLMLCAKKFSEKVTVKYFIYTPTTTCTFTYLLLSSSQLRLGSITSHIVRIKLLCRKMRHNFGVSRLPAGKVHNNL